MVIRRQQESARWRASKILATNAAALTALALEASVGQTTDQISSGPNRFASFDDYPQFQNYEVLADGRLQLNTLDGQAIILAEQDYFFDANGLQLNVARIDSLIAASSAGGIGGSAGLIGLGLGGLGLAAAGGGGGGGGSGGGSPEPPAPTPPANRAPAFSSAVAASVSENETNAIDADASDPDGDSITYSLSGADAGIFDINRSSGVVTFKAAPNFEAPADGNADNIYNIVITASDGTNATDQAVAITVSDINEPPIVSSPLPDMAAQTGETFSIAVPADTFSDPDSQLTLAARLTDGSPLPAWLSFDAEAGVFSGAPGQADAGTIEIALSASDGTSEVVDVFTLTVTGGTTNGPPVAANDAATTPEDTAVTLSVLDNDADPDGQVLTIAQVAGQDIAVGATIDVGDATVRRNADGSLTITPDTDFNGPIAFTYRVSDGSAFAEANISVTVTPVNDAPVIVAPLADQTATTGQSFTFTFAANAFQDIDNASLVFTAAGLPNGITFDPNSRTFSGAPASAGQSVITVTASDGALEVSDDFTLDVDAPPPPPAPLSFAGETSNARVVDLAEAFWLNAARILPLGDSNTHGFDNSIPQSIWESYRLDFWNLALKDGLWFDYVGGRNNGPGDLPDRSHQGVSGIEATQVVPLAAGHAQQYQPDVVLLMLGTNDALRENDAADTAPGDILSIVQNLATQRPNVTVLIAPLPPLSDATAAAIRDAINAQLPDIAAQARALGIDAHYVPMPTLDTSDLTDGIHLTPEGFQVIAEAFYGALTGLIVTDNGTFGGARTMIDEAITDVLGSELGDSIKGDSNVNALDGRGGNDRIEGRAGADALTGGAGADVFFYHSPADGGDTISDFTPGSDRIELSSQGFSALSAGQTNALGSLVFYNSDTGGLTYDVDGVGGNPGILIATLLNAPALTAADLVITANGGSVLLPVILDMGADGLKFGVTWFDFDNDGAAEEGHWPLGDALLALDRNGDGLITNGSELSFVGDHPGARTDLEGLRAYDENADGYLTPADHSFGRFAIWRDDGDGVSQPDELTSLFQAGVTSISLIADGAGGTNADGGVIFGWTDVAFEDDSIVRAADAGIFYVASSSNAAGGSTDLGVISVNGDASGGEQNELTNTMLGSPERIDGMNPPTSFLPDALEIAGRPEALPQAADLVEGWV